MNVKISVFVICVKVIIYFLLYNLHNCTFNYSYPLLNRWHNFRHLGQMCLQFWGLFAMQFWNPSFERFLVALEFYSKDFYFAWKVKPNLGLLLFWNFCYIKWACSFYSQPEAWESYVFSILLVTWTPMCG